MREIPWNVKHMRHKIARHWQPPTPQAPALHVRTTREERGARLYLTYRISTTCNPRSEDRQTQNCQQCRRGESHHAGASRSISFFLARSSYFPPLPGRSEASRVEVWKLSSLQTIDDFQANEFRSIGAQLQRLKRGQHPAKSLIVNLGRIL